MTITKQIASHLTLLAGALLCAPAFASPLQQAAFTPTTHEAPQTSFIVHIADNEDTISPAQLTKAQKFVQDLADGAIGFLADPKLTTEQKTKEFDALLNNRFDLRSIGRFAIGRYWRSLSETEQEEYTALFKDMILKVYSRRFSDYTGQKVAILSARPEGSRDILVASAIKQEQGPDISLDWRIRPDKDTGKFQVIDVIVEGVSMALTQRSEFASVIQRGGGKADIILAHLRAGEAE